MVIDTMSHHVKIKIFNDIDATSYDIMYTKNGNICKDDIQDKIVQNVINISLSNKIRSKEISYDFFTCEFNEDNSVFRIYNKTKCLGHLCSPCTYVFDI